MKIHIKKHSRQFIKGYLPGLAYQKENSPEKFLRGNFLVPKKLHRKTLKKPELSCLAFLDKSNKFSIILYSKCRF